MRLVDESISQESEEMDTKLLRAVHDRYRCPETFLDSRLAGKLSADPGYFEFGSDTVCYGRSLAGAPASKPSPPFPDVLPSASACEGQVVLPFDPGEVIDNLRLERYPCSRMGKSERLLKDIYYQLRPLTNRAFRIGIQRLRAATAKRGQFPEWPVDTTVEKICERLLMLALKARGSETVPFVWFWPEGARGCVAMTHDVETRAGRDFSPRLADIDDSFEVKSSFQVVPRKRYKVTPKYLDDLRTRGFELCVQDLNHDGRLFDDREEFLRRVPLINRYGQEFGASGFRSAVLYRNLDWFQELDFSYDMSVPNVAPFDPQRGGCCTVMPYFIGNVLELPLTTIQDYTLFYVLNERSIEIWMNQMERIFERNGMAMFLVHPDYILESDTLAIYKQLLATLSRLRGTRELWLALPGEIDRWWRARNRMSIEKRGASWRILGEGAERAVLAFARVVDDRLIYELAGAPRDEPQLSDLVTVPSAEALS